MLRLKGRNVEENPHVKMGAYHTIDLELNRCVLLVSDIFGSLGGRVRFPPNPSICFKVSI